MLSTAGKVREFSYGFLHIGMLVPMSSVQTMDAVYEQWMLEIDEERERVRELHAINTIWGWWDKKMGYTIVYKTSSTTTQKKTNAIP